jgi:hypothetical protein
VAHLKSERITQCAPSQASARVREFFARLGNEEAVRVRLKARMRIPALGIELPLRRIVIARIHRYSDNDHLIEVEWNPGSNLLPRFNGLISVESVGKDVTRLVLNGIYHPPMGRLGHFLDRIIGRHVAQTTAAELLESIGRNMERPEAPVRT